MKKIWTTIAIAVTACLIESTAAKPGATVAIDPGKCVGSVCLGDTRVSVLHALGRPSRSVSARKGMRVDIWNSDNCLNFLFVASKGGTIREIHFNSPAFKTGSGISVLSDYATVSASFPGGQADAYAIFDTGKNRVDWEDTSQGITFSFAGDSGGPMVRIAVHERHVSKQIGYSRGDAFYWYPTCTPKR